MRAYKVKLRSVRSGDVVGSVTDISPRESKVTDLLPWLAIFVSIMSFVLTVVQAASTRAHDKLSVLPHLTIGANGVQYPPVGIWLHNTGVGPAIIKSLEIIYKGKNLSLNKLRDTYLVDASGKPGQIVYDDVNIRDFYPAGQNETIISEKGKYDEAMRARLWNAIDNDTEIRIKYCSVYNECWSVCLASDDNDCATKALP